MRHGITLALFLSTVVGAALPAATSAQDEGFVISPGGVKLHYRIVGVGRDTIVVIADGPAGHMNSLSPDYAELTRRHRVLFYDQRGGGKSTAPMRASEVGLADQVRDLEALRGYMGFKQMRVVGHGFGALIALRYALQYADRVARIALVSPIPVRASLLPGADTELLGRLAEADAAKLKEARTAYLAATPANALAACHAVTALEKPALVGAPASLPRVKGDPCNAPPEALLFALNTAAPAVARELGEWDFRTAMRGVAQPVLVIQGQRDVLPQSSAQEWTMAFPQARLLAPANVGRFPQAEQAAAYATALDAFFAGRWPEGATAVTTVIAQARE